MSEPIVTTIDLIRHGEPVGGRRYRGQIDDPLSDKGWQQMRSAVGDHVPWDRIVTSPLSRCAEFAQELAERHGLPVEREPRLMELGFGEWEGRTANEIIADDSERLFRFWSDPVNNRPPGGERLLDFKGRIVAAWDALLDNYPGEQLLLVGHAGQIRMTLSHVLQMPLEAMFHIQVANASLSRIVVDHHPAERLPRLIFHGGSL